MPQTRRSALKTLALAAGASALHLDASGQAAGWPQDVPLPPDPLRPQYHLQPLRGWMNDPCGPIFWRGEYHMFHQYNPHAAVWGDMNWAHAVSKDMVHWRRLPVALSPTRGSADSEGCFTGTAVVHDGVPTFIYTGVQTVAKGDATLADGNNTFRETQCLATSTDPSLRVWKKLPQPVIPTPPPGMQVTGFRDPSPFRFPKGFHKNPKDDVWYLVVASGIPQVGGNILLYRSPDLRAWEYLHPLIQGTWRGTPGANPVDTGEMWECPDFFFLGDKFVLIHSTEGKTLWQTGVVDPATLLFLPERTGELDYGKAAYYAPKSQLDADGNRILWGWIPETRPEAEFSKAGWSGMMSLPRVLTVEGGELRFAPAAQTKSLRGTANRDAARLTDTAQEFLCVLQTGGQAPATDAASGTSPSDTYTIADPAGPLVELRFRAGQGATIVLIGDRRVEVPGGLGESASLHLFCDNSVIEVFLDGRVCVTQRFYARTAGQPVVRLTLPGPWSVAKPQSFPIRTIWT